MIFGPNPPPMNGAIATTWRSEEAERIGQPIGSQRLLVVSQTVNRLADCYPTGDDHIDSRRIMLI